MKEENKKTYNPTVILNYFLNRYMPFILTGTLLFLEFGYGAFLPYVILGMMFFVSSYSFKCGMANMVLVIEEGGVDISKIVNEKLKETE